MTPPAPHTAPQTTPHTTRAAVLRAALWMSGAIIAFSSMAVAGRAVSQTHDTFEIMAFRSLVGLAIVLAIGAAAGTLGQIGRGHLRLHLLRNGAHFIGQNLWFFAVTVIPLAQVFALEFTSPLWVVILAPLLLAERMTKTRALAAVMGFAGVMIVARPGAEPLSAGVVAAALAAVFFALTILMTKRLTRSESITAILFYLTALQSILGLICAGWDGQITLPNADTWPWLILIAGAGLGAHFCLTRALSIAPASVVVPIDFARLPLIGIVGALVYDEALDPLVFLGAAVIFAGNYLNILAETRAARQAGQGLSA